MELELDLAERLLLREAFLAVRDGSKHILMDLLPKLNDNLCISFFASKHCRCGFQMEMTTRESNNAKRYALGHAQDIIEDGYCYHPTSKDKDLQQLVTISLLHFACLFAHKDIVKLLIEHGANVNSQTSLSGYTPLQITLYSQKNEKKMSDIMSILLDNGGDSSQRDSAGTLLHNAVNKGCLSIVELLLSHKCDINAEDYKSQTALYLAVKLKRLDMVEILVRNNADVNKGPPNNPVPLIAAVRTGACDIVHALLSTPLANIEIDKRCEESALDNRRFTALHYASYQGNLNIVKLLLTHKADVNTVDSEGNTPLISSVLVRNIQLMKALIEFGADVNICSISGYGAIHRAAWEGKEEHVDILLAHGCHCDTRTGDGNTPLALACHGGHESIALKLLNFNVNVNNSDKDQDTPLHYASNRGCVETCKRLVELGADPNARNITNITPLWNAVYKSSRSVVKYLIELNVSMNVISNGFDKRYRRVANKEPHTPLHVAFRDIDDPYIASMLIIAEVNVSEETWLSSTDLEVFNVTGSDYHVDLLRSYIKSPVSLKRLCRDEIRRRLATRLADALPLLDLPASLTDYLLIKHDLELCEAGTLDLLKYKFY